MEGKLEKTTGDKEKLAPVSGATAALCIEKSPILALIFHKLFKTQNVGISAFQLPPLTTISPLGFRKTMMAQRTFVHQERDNTSLPCENISWHSGANTFGLCLTGGQSSKLQQMEVSKRLEWLMSFWLIQLTLS